MRKNRIKTDAREPFLNILETYARASRDKARTADALALMEHVKSHSDCFLRLREEGAKHIGASTFLMTPDLKKGLFIWHTKIGRWTQPGGHADGDPDIRAVARRELYQEVGISSKLLEPTPFALMRYDFDSETYGYRKSIYNLFFLSVVPENQEPRMMEPSLTRLRWADPAEAAEFVHPDDLQLIKSWDTRIRRLRGAP